MVDIRQEVCGVIVSGTPAPGINGVISAVVIQCLRNEIVPIGFLYGFKYLRQGITKYYTTLRIQDVTRIQNRGGSILYTSKDQLQTEEEIENTIRALQHLRVKYVITIGGTDTAFSAHKLAQGFQKRSLFYQQNLLNHSPFSEQITPSNTTPARELSPNSIDSSSFMAQMVHNSVILTHVPKTIFNDLPLPPNCTTFGFNTAKEIGTKIVADLSADAKAMNRWYIVTTIGSKSGHLTLGIGTASSATICLIPEEFIHKKTTKSQYLAAAKQKFDVQNTLKSLQNMPEFTKKHGMDQVLKSMQNKRFDDFDEKNEEFTHLHAGGVDFEEYVDILDATMIKRAAIGKMYGVAVIGEGLVDLLKKQDLDKYFNGSISEGHELFAHKLKTILNERWNKRKMEMYIRTKFVGFELRSADPNANDMILSRELGFSAVLTCTAKKVNATIVTMKGGELVTIPLSEIVDPETLDLTTKIVDTKSLSFQVAQSYMIKLNRSDLQEPKNVKKYADIAGLTTDEFVDKYKQVAVLDR